jgi:tetratricopeptide (TPR) repeat protein
MFARGLCLLLILALASTASARSPAPARAQAAKRSAAIDDSLRLHPAADLALSRDGIRKAEALANFIEGARLEENGEIEEALKIYQKVLTVDPGETELASRVALLLTRQDDVPRAIDVLKDAIKANPKPVPPYLQLAFLYAKYLKKPEQALKYANQAIALDPENIDAYQRVYEIEVNAGDPRRALAALDRALKVNSDNPIFWIGLGKLYASVVLQNDASAKPEELARVNTIFKRAADTGADNPAVLKDVADFYAASQQIEQAIPLYLRVIELQPEDQNAREKLATGFVMTNQRARAAELLQEIIRESPAKHQPYELLAQLQDEEALALARANRQEEAKAEFAKAAANYEQSILINPAQPRTYLRLSELLIGALRQPERAERILAEARVQFPAAPEFIYYLALAQREAKKPNQAVITFEEALNEAEARGATFVNARFYFDYGAAAEQAQLYDKAAELFRRSIALDPRNADAYNHLGYMWAEQNTNLDEAEQMIRHALEIDPDNGAYIDSLGWVHYRKGRYEEALRELQRAAQHLTRDDPTVFDHIGDTLAKLNRIPQALEYWQKAAALDPENSTLAEKIQSTRTKMSKGDAALTAPRK